MAQGFPQPRRGRDFRAAPGKPRVVDRPHRQFRQALHERSLRRPRVQPPGGAAKNLRKTARFLNPLLKGRKAAAYGAAAAAAAAYAAYKAGQMGQSPTDNAVVTPGDPGTPTPPGPYLVYARTFDPVPEDVGTLPRTFETTGVEGGYQHFGGKQVAQVMGWAADRYIGMGTSWNPTYTTATPLDSSWRSALSWEQWEDTSTTQPPARRYLGHHFFVRGYTYPQYDNTVEASPDVFVYPEPATIPNIPRYQAVGANTIPATIPWYALQAFKQYLSEVSPDPNPIPRFRVQPKLNTGITITIPPSGQPRISRGPNHTNSPPRKGQQEKKGKSKFDAAFDILGEAMGFDGQKGKKYLNLTTEVLDWLDAIYFALPEDVILAERARTPQAKAAAIVKHFDELDVATVLKNIVVMEVGDRVLAKMSKDAKRTFDITTLFGAAL